MVCEDNSTISVEPPFKKTQKFDIPKVLIEDYLVDHKVGYKNEKIIFTCPEQQAPLEPGPFGNKPI